MTMQTLYLQYADRNYRIRAVSELVQDIDGERVEDVVRIERQSPAADQQQVYSPAVFPVVDGDRWNWTQCLSLIDQYERDLFEMDAEAQQRFIDDNEPF